MDAWVALVGLDPAAYGTHSLRRTKVSLLYMRTGNLRACPLLLGHTKLGRRGADHLMIRMNYSGPIDLGLYRISPYLSANASWSHALTDRVSTVLTISDIIGPPTVRSSYLSDDALARQFTRSVGPTVKVSVTYSLGQVAR